MNPIQLLMDEHRLIEGVIASLDAYAGRVATGEDLPRTDLAAYAAFLVEFVDRHHHGKEEDVLFREMAARGMPTHAGPLAVMLQEHEEGRELTRALGYLGARTGPFAPAERAELQGTVGAYAGLLSGHIEKEDEVLYPMADSMLPDAVWARIASVFETFEREPAHAERARVQRESARLLQARYTVSSRAAGPR
jgi:hemerythrin-like domain-containing protein